MMKLPDDIDEECQKLCEVINRFPGIQTICSCCGHNKTPFHIWFTAKSLICLPELLYWFDGCHCGYYDWQIFVETDCAKSPVHFCIEGPVGAYKQADEIATLIVKNDDCEKHIDDEIDI